MGWVSISSSPWAYVRVDEGVEDQTPIATIALAAGEHRLRLRRDGFYPVEHSFKLDPGQRLRLNFDLTPAEHGSLRIVLESPGWAYFELGSSAKGELPQGALSLPTGVYKLKVFREGFTPVEKSVEVQANQEAFLPIRLEPAPAAQGTP